MWRKCVKLPRIRKKNSSDGEIGAYRIRPANAASTRIGNDVTSGSCPRGRGFSRKSIKHNSYNWYHLPVSSKTLFPRGPRACIFLYTCQRVRGRGQVCALEPKVLRWVKDSPARPGSCAGVIHSVLWTAVVLASSRWVNLAKFSFRPTVLCLLAQYYNPRDRQFHPSICKFVNFFFNQTNRLKSFKFLYLQLTCFLCTRFYVTVLSFFTLQSFRISIIIFISLRITAQRKNLSLGGRNRPFELTPMRKLNSLPLFLRKIKLSLRVSRFTVFAHSWTESYRYGFDTRCSNSARNTGYPGRLSSLLIARVTRSRGKEKAWPRPEQRGGIRRGNCAPRSKFSRPSFAKQV